METFTLSQLLSEDSEPEQETSLAQRTSDQEQIQENLPNESDAQTQQESLFQLIETQSISDSIILSQEKPKKIEGTIENEVMQIILEHKNIIGQLDCEAQQRINFQKKKLIQEQQEIIQEGFLFQTKAGLENVDTTKIAKVIKNASKNSEFYKTEER